MIGSILIFLAVLSVLVLVHELGHFIAAKRAGVWVEEFGFGIPPRIIGKKIGETIYSLNLLPFGGFVRLHGESTEEGISYPSRAFLAKSKKTRFFIIIAGVVMNFVLAILAFGLIYTFTGIPRVTDNVRIVGVNADSPAEMAGLMDGDLIKEVDGESITSTKQFIEVVEEKGSNEITLSVQRGSQMEKISLYPRENPPEGEGVLGVVITSTEIYYAPIWQRPAIGAYYGLQEAIFWGKTVIEGFVMIFSQLFVGKVPQDVAGPVGIFALTSQAASFGIVALVNFVGILSVNLAILNVLPFPALDGGRLLFIIIESVIGRKVTPKIEAAIHTAGMIILIFLLLAITAHDVERLISAGGISGFVDSVFK